MAGGVITTGAHPKLLWPGIRAIWGRTYDQYDTEHTDLFDQVSSDKNYEEYLEVGGFGLAQIKPQGQGVAYDTEAQGQTMRLTNVTLALGYIVTWEELNDNLYEVVSKRRAIANATSMRQTKEFIGANIYNRAFNATYVGGDNVPLCSLVHPQIYGGTLANKPTVDVDLSEQALEDAIIGIMGLTDARGLLIKLMPRSLHVPRQEWFNANRILKSVQQSGTANNDLNILRVTNALPEGIKVNHYFSSAHAWFIRTRFAAEQGMIYQERTKVQFDQDNDFDTKNAKAASFERYVFGWGDWRSVWGVNGP